LENPHAFIEYILAEGKPMRKIIRYNPDLVPCASLVPVGQSGQQDYLLNGMEIPIAAAPTNCSTLL